MTDKDDRKLRGMIRSGIRSGSSKRLRQKLRTGSGEIFTDVSLTMTLEDLNLKIKNIDPQSDVLEIPANLGFDEKHLRTYCNAQGLSVSNILYDSNSNNYHVHFRGRIK